MAKFNSGTDSLYADTLWWSGATSDTFPVDPDFTRSANFALQRITAAIQKCDNSWKYNDSNSSTELIDSSTNLTATSKYSISLSWLKIARVRVKDPNGNWITLKKVRREELSDADLAEVGTPRAYYKLGKYIYLVGTPNYTAALGLEVQFQTSTELFLVSDTTKEPGFAPQFHRLVSLLSALDFTMANEMDKRTAKILSIVGREPDPSSGDAGAGMFRELVIFYTERDQDGGSNLSVQDEDYGASSLSGD